MIHGVDVSSCQPPLDYAQLRSAGVAFAWVKATEGLSIVDGSHDAHSTGFRAAGVVTGSYHFAHTSHDPNAEADFFTSHAFFDQLRPVVDMETLAAGKVPDNAGPHCLAWLRRLQANTGVVGMIYGSTSYLMAMLRQCPALSAYDVWAAAYRVPPTPDHLPSLPGWPAQKLLAYQWTGSGRLPGCPVAIDRDVLAQPDLDGVLVPSPNV